MTRGGDAGNPWRRRQGSERVTWAWQEEALGEERIRVVELRVPANPPAHSLMMQMGKLRLTEGK